MEVRTNRRYAELIKKGEQVSVEEVQANIAKRDYIDSSRDDSPLIIPENAIVLSNDKEGLTGLFNIATAEIDIRLVVESNPEALIIGVQKHIEDLGYTVLKSEPKKEERLTNSKIIRL